MSVIGPVYTDIHPKTTLNRVKGDVMPFRWSLNPYRGCTHGCSFCYARATHTYLDLPADDTFRTQIMVKSDAADVLERQIVGMLRQFQGDLVSLIQHLGPVAIGTATDPYQPVEARRTVTRSCLEVLQAYSIPITITTRSPLILRDVDLLRHMDVRAVHISLHTVDTAIWRLYEPATPSPAKRLEAASRLVADGIPVSIFIAPVLPFLTDSVSALDDVCAGIRATGVTGVMASILRLSPDVKRWFTGVLRQNHPKLVTAYNALFRQDYVSTGYQSMLHARVDRVLMKHGLQSYRYPEDGAGLPGKQVISEPSAKLHSDSVYARQMRLSI